ncbi:MAG: hypothetical protein R3F17_08865 [Planctomycetota bacterium]
MPPDRPQEFALLQSVSRISCLANELRLKILGTLATARVLPARWLRNSGEPATLIHYHMKRLLDADLVREVAVAAESKGAPASATTSLSPGTCSGPGHRLHGPRHRKDPGGLDGAGHGRLAAGKGVRRRRLQALAQRIIGDCLRAAPETAS